MKLALIALHALLICGAARGQSPEESLRAYADSMATLISQNKEDELLEQFVTIARAGRDQSELLKPLAELRQTSGAILKSEYRNKVQGRTIFPGEVVPHLTFWYAIETEREVENEFLTITIAAEGDNPRLVTFRVVTVEEPMPGFLKQAQQFNMPKQQWLTRLKPMVSQGFCKGAGSPFMQVYKGTAEGCVTDVEKLFDHCATSEPAVVLPDALVSVRQGTWYGQVMGECISAHYQGGALLEAFRALQRTVVPPKDVG